MVVILHESSDSDEIHEPPDPETSTRQPEEHLQAMLAKIEVMPAGEQDDEGDDWGFRLTPISPEERALLVG